MNEVKEDSYGVLIEPTTLRIERLLPGPIERVWSYLTKNELRRQWMATIAEEMTEGAPFEFVWRNSELTNPPGVRPAGFGEEHRMKSTIIEMVPPRKLVFTWQGSGDVTIELEPKGNDVLLTVVHRRLPDRSMLLKVSAGWHTHLDLMVARVSGTDAGAFWDNWTIVQREYEKRLP